MPLPRPLLCVGVLVYLAAAQAGAAGPPAASGEQKVLVILARFPDIAPSFSSEELQTKYFDKLDRYLRAVSYGKASVTGKMTAWHTLPRPVADYRLSPHNLAVDKGRVRQLIQDAIDLADADEDFTRYSMIFLSLGAKQSDYGMMGLCGYPGMLGWQQELPARTRGRQQSIPGGVAIFCENAHVGVVFHDMAHILGGVRDGRRVLPCLYDHDLQAQRGPFRNYAQFYLTNVGFFDPMSCHFLELRRGPPGPCAFTKLRLGWLDPAKLVEVPRGGARSVRLGPLSDGRADTLAVKVPLGPATYYLIENRQPLGPDVNLPSHGVLIYYCDDGVAECRKGASPIKLVDANPATPELRAAPFTADGNNTFTDAKRGVSVRVIAHRGLDREVHISNAGQPP